jgi:hypothetical protein
MTAPRPVVTVGYGLATQQQTLAALDGAKAA